LNIQYAKNNQENSTKIVSEDMLEINRNATMQALSTANN